MGDALAWLFLGTRVLEKLRRSTLAAWPEAQPVMVPSGTLGTGWPQLLQSDLQSYKQLPLALNGRRALDPRLPLHGVALSQSLEWAGVSNETIDPWRQGIVEGFDRLLLDLGLPTMRLPRGPRRRAWVVRSTSGEAELAECPNCGYAAFREAATFARAAPPAEPPAELQRVATPGADTIGGLADLLGVDRRKTLKAMFYVTRPGEVVLAVLRGDLDVETAKLETAIGSSLAGPSSEAAIRQTGAVPGYASPIGLKVRTSSGEPGLQVVADLSVQSMANFVAGANEQGFHVTGVNFPRDFAVSGVADIARVEAGFPCAQCGAGLGLSRGSELATASILSEVVRFAGPNGAIVEAPIFWCGMRPEAVLFAVAESFEGEGLAWPRSIAPFDVHVLPLVDAPEIGDLTGRLTEEGLDVLIDDRQASAGVKLTEADWIGAPCRVIVGARSLAQGGAELRRSDRAPEIVAWGDLEGAILSLLG
ncbi:MAG TPA: YbaK/EbsC family protein [Anaerolineales bacterium]|nr:YbaK/EbsC family protein [Anaerolineales bacterium]